MENTLSINMDIEVRECLSYPFERQQGTTIGKPTRSHRKNGFRLKSIPRLSCQDLHFPDGFDLKNKSKLSIRSVDYHLEWSSEARFWKIAGTGSTQELS